ncbi:SAVED domain-containing protein [Bacillaceae bacterium SIJ1]|uniref:SAVED domain-containing protein n=1 Tax=Litoribacterium kuwaitense TaxID=1398745 RepID=UPI0013EC997E|nr:SAVED domain-containing protein [Litoribacterium kuwaitense]NGP44604.1 SAVED domain-containing protein [Litoribacterium kuwaitense]
MHDVFVSYAHENKDPVIRLQHAILASGLTVWRDDDALNPGHLESEIRANIQRSSAYLLYVSEDMLASDCIWNVEIPEAYRQYTKDNQYVISFIFPEDDDKIKARFGERFQALTNLSYHEFYYFDDHQTLETICKKLVSALKKRKSSSDEWRVGLITRQAFYVANDNHDFLINASPFFANAENNYDLLRVGMQVVRKHVNSNVRLCPVAHLSACVMLGQVFSKTTGKKITIEGNKTIWSITENDHQVNERTIDFADFAGNADCEDIVVAVDFTGNHCVKLVKEVETYVQKNALPHAKRYTWEKEAGEISSEEAAVALVKGFDRALRRISNLQETATIHLFMAAPAPFAVMFGQLLNIVPGKEIKLYEYSNGTYQPTIVLDSNKDGEMIIEEPMST